MAKHFREAIVRARNLEPGDYLIHEGVHHLVDRVILDGRQVNAYVYKNNEVVRAKYKYDDFVEVEIPNG